MEKIKKKMELDEFFFKSDDSGEYEAVLKEFSQDRKWFSSDETFQELNPGTPVMVAERMGFVPLEDMPIMLQAIKKGEFTKKSASKDYVRKHKIADSVSDDALLDTMSGEENHGTSLMCFVDDGDAYPIGWSAIPALQMALGLRANGQANLQSSAPADLAKVYNTLADAAGVKGFTACLAHGKWRAFNGPRYAVTDDTDIWAACADMMKKYPLAKFACGSISHDRTRWVIDLAEYKNTLFGKYAQILGNYSPVLLVETSNTRDSAVRLTPGIKIGSLHAPLAVSVIRKHTCKGDYDERIATMKDVVRQAFDEVMPRFEEAAKEAAALQSVPITNGDVALENALYTLGFPQKESMEVIAQFRGIYGVDMGDTILYPNVTAYDVWLSICDVASLAEASGKYSPSALIALSEGCARAVRMNWQTLDVAAVSSWVKRQNVQP